MDTFSSHPSARPVDYASEQQSQDWNRQDADIQDEVSGYKRAAYNGLLRHEVIAPAVCNDGTLSGYPDKLGKVLAGYGFNWTAVETIGCWNGKVEPGRQFTLFADRWFDNSGNFDTRPFPGLPSGQIFTADTIGYIARQVMTDQDAIQVVVDCPVRLIEA